MTPWHFRYLSECVTNDFFDELGATLGAVSTRMLNADDRKELPCSPLSDEMRATLNLIRQTPTLSQLTVIDYVNQNETTGFVGYAFQTPQGEVIIAFRGSEWFGCTAQTIVDWVDNFAAPFKGSIQYPQIEAMIAEYPDGAVTYTGHSKGGHNALYALAKSPNDEAVAVAFNGQGFPSGYIKRGAARRLRRNGVNYVVQDDMVGALMRHPERRVFVKKNGDGPAHALSSFTFDQQGQPVPAHRPLYSYLIEFATRMYLSCHERSARKEAKKALPQGA